MKLYISTKKITLDIEHEIVLMVSDKEFYGYDILIELPDKDKFIKKTLDIKYKKDKDDKETKEIESKEFKVREQITWHSFPLYEIIDGKIVDFDYTKYQYFINTDRREALSDKINSMYNLSSVIKIQRKTLKKILDHLGIEDEGFEKYNTKIEQIIIHNPKEK